MLTPPPIAVSAAPAQLTETALPLPAGKFEAFEYNAQFLILFPQTAQDVAVAFTPLALFIVLVQVLLDVG